MVNPFWTVTNWIDENMDYAPIGAFIGLGIAILLAVIFGGLQVGDLLDVISNLCAECHSAGFVFYGTEGVLVMPCECVCEGDK